MSPQNPDRKRAYMKRWRERHREALRVRDRERAHRPDIKLRHNQTNRRRHRERKLAAIHLLGGACQSCGFADHRALEFDHRNGDGARRRAAGERGPTHRWVEQRPEDFQVLCANCHRIKDYEFRQKGPKKEDV